MHAVPILLNCYYLLGQRCWKILARAQSSMAYGIFQHIYTRQIFLRDVGKYLGLCGGVWSWGALQWPPVVATVHIPQKVRVIHRSRVVNTQQVGACDQVY